MHDHFLCPYLANAVGAIFFSVQLKSDHDNGLLQFGSKTILKYVLHLPASMKVAVTIPDPALEAGPSLIVLFILPPPHSRRSLGHAMRAF